MNTSSDGLLMTMDTNTFDREDLGSVFKRGLYSNAQTQKSFYMKPNPLSNMAKEIANTNVTMEPYHHEESRAASFMNPNVNNRQDYLGFKEKIVEMEQKESTTYRYTIIIVVVITFIVVAGILWLLSTCGDGNIVNGVKKLFSDEHERNLHEKMSQKPETILQETNGNEKSMLAFLPEDAIFSSVGDNINNFTTESILPQNNTIEIIPQQQNTDFSSIKEEATFHTDTDPVSTVNEIYNKNKSGISGTTEGRRLYDELGGKENDEYMRRIERPEYDPAKDDTLNIEKNRLKKIGDLYAEHEALRKPDPNYNVHGIASSALDQLPKETLAPTRDENYRIAHQKKHLLMASSTKAVHDIYTNKSHSRTEKMPEFVHNSKTVNGNGIEYVNIHDQSIFGAD